LSDRTAEPVRQSPDIRRQLRVIPLAEALQHGETGRGRERIARQGARLVDGPERGELRHDVTPAPERSKRQASADHLPEAPQVRLHAESPGGSGASDAEAGDHLVEDEQGADAVASGAEPFEIARSGDDEPHVRRHRLDDDARDRVVDHGDLVVGRDDRARHGARWHAGRVREAESGNAASSPCQEGVAVAVVAARELHHPLPAGRGAREPDDRHGGFGSRRHETDLVATRHRRRDHLGEADLAFGRGAVGGAPRRSLGNRLEHGRMGMTQD